MYQDGRGVVQDGGKAVELWAKAAQLDGAVAALERALDIAEHCASAAGTGMTEGPPSIMALLRTLGKVYEQQGDAAKANQARQRAATLLRAQQ